MFKVLGNAWKIADLRKKILYTLLILLIYRLGCYIPIPGVNASYIAEQVANYSVLGFLEMFSGGALGNMTIFALGITPVSYTHLDVYKRQAKCHGRYPHFFTVYFM